MVPSNPKWATFPYFYFSKRYVKLNKNTLCNPNYTIKQRGTCTRIVFSIRTPTRGLSISMQPERDLSQPFMFGQQILLFTSVNKSTCVFVVHDALKVEKRTIRRNKPADSPITRFETAPVQRRRRKGTKIGVLPYHFNQCNDSR
jgi:hypothetical protein